jgi:hypothetical protein
VNQRLRNRVRSPLDRAMHSRLDEDLHTTSESEDKVESGLLLNVYESAWVASRNMPEPEREGDGSQQGDARRHSL